MRGLDDQVRYDRCCVLLVVLLFFSAALFILSVRNIKKH